MTRKKQNRSVIKQKRITRRKIQKRRRRMAQIENINPTCGNDMVTVGNSKQQQQDEAMTRKNSNRSVIKQKRKIRRKLQKQRRRMAQFENINPTCGNNMVTVGNSKQQQQDEVKKTKNVETNVSMQACNYYDVPEDAVRSWYERIRNKLNEDANKRVYHNWSCMLAPKRIELEKAKPYLVLAAFFQYYEFDLEKSFIQDNCKIFKKFCEDGMIEDEKMKQTVCYLLGDKTTEPIDSGIDNDMAFLQDLDLLILASSPDVYKNYAELSRREWSTSGKTNFDMLRRKTLTTLLALDIYQTPEFSKKYAKAARANIEQELKELENC